MKKTSWQQPETFVIKDIRLDPNKQYMHILFVYMIQKKLERKNRIIISSSTRWRRLTEEIIKHLTTTTGYLYVETEDGKPIEKNLKKNGKEAIGI